MGSGEASGRVVTGSCRDAASEPCAGIIGWNRGPVQVEPDGACGDRGPRACWKSAFPRRVREEPVLCRGRRPLRRSLGTAHRDASRRHFRRVSNKSRGRVVRLSPRRAPCRDRGSAGASRSRFRLAHGSSYTLRAVCGRIASPLARLASVGLSAGAGSQDRMTYFTPTRCAPIRRATIRWTARVPQHAEETARSIHPSTDNVSRRRPG